MYYEKLILIILIAKTMLNPYNWI